MNVRIKETEKYKWIYQDDYDKWFKNRNSVNRANVYHFVMEKQVDWILNLSYPYQNVYDINKFFLLGNYLYNNNRRKINTRVYIISGIVFGNDDYYNICDIDKFNLLAINVIDKETNAPKILVNKQYVNTGLIKELKTSINKTGMSSRKDIILLEDFSEYIEYFDYFDDKVPFDKIQDEYCDETAEEVLSLLKQSITTQDEPMSFESLLAEEDVEEDDDDDYPF